MCGHCSGPGAGLLSQFSCIFFSAKITRSDGLHAPATELRKYPLPVAPGRGALVLLKYVVLERTRKYDDVSTWALFFLLLGPRRCIALGSSAWQYTINYWCSYSSGRVCLLEYVITHFSSGGFWVWAGWIFYTCHWLEHNPNNISPCAAREWILLQFQNIFCKLLEYNKMRCFLRTKTWLLQKPQSSFALPVFKAQQILCSTWIINGDKLEEEALLSYQSQASSGWLTLQRKAAPSEAMSEQVLGESGLCQYARKMTACFGHLGKEIKYVRVDLLVSVM